MTATNAPVCYWQYTMYDALTEEEDRWQVYADYNFDITDSTSFHIEGMYADTEIPIYRTSPSYAALQAPTSTAQRGGTLDRRRPVFRAREQSGLRGVRRGQSRRVSRPRRASARC